MKSILYFLLLMGTISSEAQSYNVALIPDYLKKDARAVIREDEYILEIKSPEKAVSKEHHVYTVLKEAGDALGGYKTRYNKFISINSISGSLYDSIGKELKRMKKKDMEDVSAVGQNLMDDERYKEYNFYCRIYPYTSDSAAKSRQ